MFFKEGEEGANGSDMIKIVKVNKEYNIYTNNCQNIDNQLKNIKIEEQNNFYYEFTDTNKCIHRITLKNENIAEKYAEKYFYEAILYNLNVAIQSYENLQFRDVMKYAFYEMINVREMYFSINGCKNSKVLDFWNEVIVNLMYPIIPSFCDGMYATNKNIRKLKIEKIVNNDNIVKNENIGKNENVVKNENIAKNGSMVLNEILKEIEWLKKLIKTIKNKVKRNAKPKIICIGINDTWSEVKTRLMECEGNIEKIKVIVDTQSISAKEKNFLVLFAMDYWNKKENYERVNEKRVLFECKEYLETSLGCEVKIEKNEKGDPLQPHIQITY
ncbi:hypothetical protein BDAP_000954 [Binucleata daphniae]